MIMVWILELVRASWQFLGGTNSLNFGHDLGANSFLENIGESRNLEEEEGKEAHEDEVRRAGNVDQSN